MWDINFGTITLQECLDAYEQRGYTFEIRDGKIYSINREEK